MGAGLGQPSGRITRLGTWEGETEEGYLLVQQALGHLAHDTSNDGIALAME